MPQHARPVRQGVRFRRSVDLQRAAPPVYGFGAGYQPGFGDGADYGTGTEAGTAEVGDAGGDFGDFGGGDFGI
jgi:hypothetical protein